MNAASVEAVREAARRCEQAGLLAEADLLYRHAASLQLADRAESASSLARLLLASGQSEEARALAVESDDRVLLGLLALESHDFAAARRLLDEARRRNPFDPRTASARGRLAFLERRFGDAVGDLLEAALLRPDGLPDRTDARFLKAARALAPGEIPGWPEAAAGASGRLAGAAQALSPNSGFPDRTASLVRALIARSASAEGVLDRARRLAETPALSGLGDRALLAAAAGGELRRLAAGSTLYRCGDPSGEISLVLSGQVRLACETPVGSQALGEAREGDFLGEEALIGAARVADARAPKAATLLGFTPDFLADDPDRAAWLRHLRACLARRLTRLNDLFRDFFPGQAAAGNLPNPAGGDAVALSAEEKSRSLSSGGLSSSDRFLFAAFAEERRFPGEAVIFREGDPGDALYAVARGRVRISRRLAGGEEAFAILPPGEIFGEMAILDPESPGRSADARAHEESSLLMLSRARFEKLERSDPEGCADLSALLCRLAARRCVETAERLARWRMMAGPG
ncbi:MAG: cyclic nucleotide-binding domain-containing protein [Acidobacteriota bacterium]